MSVVLDIVSWVIMALIIIIVLLALVSPIIWFIWRIKKKGWLKNLPTKFKGEQTNGKGNGEGQEDSGTGTGDRTDDESIQSSQRGRIPIPDPEDIEFHEPATF